MRISLLWQWIKPKLNKLDNPFTRNIGWLGGSAGIVRVSRLLTTIILARFLSPEDYGLAAIVLTSYEFVEVFTRNGIGVRLIQAPVDKVQDLAQSAYWLSWVIFISLFLIQCLIAFPVAWIYGNNHLILPICGLAINLLLIPLGTIQAALIQREGRFHVMALTRVLQVSTDNILSAILAIAGFGMWAIILPKILVTPIWVYLIRKNHPWKLKTKFHTTHWKELFNFGRNILGVELLNTLRANLDYLIVGRFLSIEALGIYYFAFNAGFGISFGIITSIKSAVLPHLCDARSNFAKFRQSYYQSLKTVAIVIIPLVLTQSILAPFYVPIIFGEKWIGAVPILILICLSAIPRPFADSASQLLIAVDKPELDLVWNVIFTSLFATALFIGVHWQSIGVAIAVFLSHILLLPIFTICASRYVFRNKIINKR